MLGGSSGIGESIAYRLASQGTNVIIAALDDKLLLTSIEKLRKAYPHLEFRSVGVDFSKDDYMEKLIKVTQDVHISLLFNNAGKNVTLRI